MSETNEFLYLRRPRSKNYEGRWRVASMFHQIAIDGQTSVCGAVKNGLHGFEIVIRNTQVLRSMTCSNCTQGRVVKS